jgi:hypothetical protein
MKRTVVVVFVCLFAASLTYGQSCTTLQSGSLKDANGNPIGVGYDQYGYNYQAHEFNGLFANYNRPATAYTEATCMNTGYGKEGCAHLQMKWNDEWLSNQSCDGDAYLDRPANYIGSGAWLTNHEGGSDVLTLSNGKQKEAHWTYFAKIVAVPEGAYRCGVDNKLWCEADGTEIGPDVNWGAFALIQEVYNDPMEAVHGKQYKSLSGPGLGIYAD